MITAASCWSWGAGLDSTAGIIQHVNAGHQINLITFADHGGERRFPDTSVGDEIGTYDFIPVFGDWLASRGYPRPVICRYQPKPVTNARYEQATLDVIRELDLERDIDLTRIKALGGIYGNCVANRTLPSLAFSIKACSVKHKLEAQEPI